MKILLIILTSFAVVSSTSVTAQQVIKPSSWKSNIDSALITPDLTIKSILPAKPDTTFPYQQHLKSKFQYSKPSTYPAPIEPGYEYNMPVMKPNKTSKILIAKLDPDFPYQYNMPVLKHGENKE
ncbi:MAG: hypothetical protein ACO1N7_02050 [Sphingobacteriaceae bacterium]